MKQYFQAALQRGTSRVEHNTWQQSHAKITSQSMTSKNLYLCICVFVYLCFCALAQYLAAKSRLDHIPVNLCMMSLTDNSAGVEQEIVRDMFWFCVMTQERREVVSVIDTAWCFMTQCAGCLMDKKLNTIHKCRSLSMYFPLNPTPPSHRDTRKYF